MRVPVNDEVSVPLGVIDAVCVAVPVEEPVALGEGVGETIAPHSEMVPTASCDGLLESPMLRTPNASLKKPGLRETCTVIHGVC